MRNPTRLGTLQVTSDERKQAANSSVNSREVGLGATLAPGDNANQSAAGGVDDGTAAVSLARVLATLSQASTEHVGGDSRSTILGSAGCARDNRDGDLPQVDWDGGSAIRSNTPMFQVSGV
jgi:hypothetical protein